jgi:NAD(P)-dependent dehydrogenase (short-subunit alcohol dehydrogenase family)
MELPFKVNLKDQVALVTGGGGVLCSTMARALAACGAKIAVADLKLDAAEAAAALIRKEGGVAISVGCNVLEKQSLATANDTVKKELGPIDILINGAGGNHPKGTTTLEHLRKQDISGPTKDLVTFYDLDPKGIEFVFNLNFLGTLLPTQAFTREMVAKGKGTIINISSMNAFRPLTKIPAYSAAKAAVSNFTQWLAVHFSKVGIRVNAIAPGFFVTDQNIDLLKNKDGSLKPRGMTIISHTPLGDFGKPEHLIGALLWLVSDEASGFVTGVVIPIDGGFAAFSGV